MTFSNHYDVSMQTYIYNYIIENRKDLKNSWEATKLTNLVLFRVYVDSAVKNNIELFEENFCAMDSGFVLASLINKNHPYANLHNLKWIYDKETGDKFLNKFPKLADYITNILSEVVNKDIDAMVENITKQPLHIKNSFTDIKSYDSISYEEIRKYYLEPDNYNSLLKCYEVQNANYDCMEK